MKKFLFIAILCLFALPSFGTINDSKVNYDENGSYVITNVIQYDEISANILYDNVRTMLSDITLEDKSENMIDYVNNESHTIVLKGKLYIGDSNHRLLGTCWNIYLSYITTIKIKDNKLQCSSKFTTFIFDWNAKQYPATHELPFNKCYPEWNVTKSDKKSISHGGNWESGYEKAIKPNTENSIRKYQMFICNKLNNISLEEDF